MLIDGPEWQEGMAAFMEKRPPRLSAAVAGLMLSMRRAAAGGLHLAGQQDGDGGEHQHHAEHRKGVAEAHHQRLPLDRIAERDDRLLLRGRGIR